MAPKLLLQQQGWALQPIEWKRSRGAPLLWRHKIHNGAAAQCGGTSFLLFFHPSFSASPGARGETAFPEERRAKRVAESGHVAQSNSGRGSIYTTFICLVVLICSLTSCNNSVKTAATAMKPFPGLRSETRKPTLVPLTIRTPLPCY